MDATPPTPEPSGPPDWAFAFVSGDMPQQPELDPDDLAAGRAALLAMGQAFAEAHRQSLLLDAAVASLGAQGATSGHIAGLGLSGPVSERLLGGTSMLEVLCRDGVAHFDGEARGPGLAG